MKHIYLDYAATTPVDKAVATACAHCHGIKFFNPASTHACGRGAAKDVEDARRKCAEAIGAVPREIIFTSGGTESVNQAMLKTELSHGKKQIIVSGLEHDSVSACAQKLAEGGYDVRYLMPNGDGMITPEALRSVITENTGLVCVMTVNNIVGTVQPVKELCEIAHNVGALFFTDAVQAVNSVDLNVQYSGVDLLAASGHKFYAPKGVGFLYVRSGIKTSPLIIGGEQEFGLRAGTVNVPDAVAMGEAVRLAVERREEYLRHVKEVSEEFLRHVRYGNVIAENAPRTGEIVSLRFDGINGGRLAVALSCDGVCCSVGSACSAGSATPPAALVNMGIEHPDCAVRFSFGRYTSKTQAVRAARILNRAAKRLSQ